MTWERYFDIYYILAILHDLFKINTLVLVNSQEIAMAFLYFHILFSSPIIIVIATIYIIVMIGYIGVVGPGETPLVGTENILYFLPSPSIAADLLLRAESNANTADWLPHENDDLFSVEE